MKALSIKQPWAWLICKGEKDIENRNWSTKFRGRIYVHTGKRFDGNSLEHLWAMGFSIIDTLIWQPYLKQLGYLGAIIGEVDVVGCKYRFGDEIDNIYSKWHKAGMYGFILANPMLYEKPIPYKGRLGFFEVENNEE